MQITISSVDGPFRRCGITHTKEPVTYPDDQFSEDELKTLEAEPMLVVRRTKASKKLKEN